MNSAHVLRAHCGPVNALAFSPTGDVLLSAGLVRAGPLRPWGIPAVCVWEHAALTTRLTGWLRAPEKLGFMDGQGVIAAATRGAFTEFRLFSSEHGKLLLDVRRDFPGTAMALQPGGQLAAAGDTEVQIWDNRFSELRHRLAWEPGFVRQLGFSPDGRRLAAWGGVSEDTRHGTVWDAWLRVWDTQSARLAWVVQTSTSEAVSGCVFSPAGDMLALVMKSVLLLDADTGRELRRLPVDGGRSVLLSAAFSPDGDILSTCGWQWSGATDDERSCRLGEVRLFRVADASPLHTFDWAPGGAYSVAFSPDGGKLAVGHGDGSIYIWRSPPSR